MSYLHACLVDENGHCVKAIPLFCQVSKEKALAIAAHPVPFTAYADCVLGVVTFAQTEQQMNWLSEWLLTHCGVSYKQCWCASESDQPMGCRNPNCKHR